MKLENIEPKKVLYFFEKVSEIPRESGKEQKIADYLVAFAKERNLECYRDEYNNVIIKKEGKGRERVALQAHIDMICEKIPESNHDFTKDPLELYVDGDFIRARGTTLGADNGIGVALILALLDDETIEMPGIEGIFTVEEETTMIGAIKLDMSKVESKKIISLDNGKEGKILLSSAICNEWGIKIKEEREEIGLEETIYSIEYKNFLGGHTGGNISDERIGNPLKLAIEAIADIEDVKIIEINGGSRVNVIPRSAKLVFSVKTKDVIEKVKENIEEQLSFYKQFCDKVEITIQEIENRNKEFSIKATKKFIEFVSNYINGVIKKDEKGNIILTSSLGKIETTEEGFYIEISSRCNYKNIKEEYEKTVNKQFEACNAEIVWSQELKGIEPKENNELVNTCKKIYEELYGEKMQEVISQGAVEGGFFLDKKPEAEYTCIGPNTFDVHSPQERLSIISVQKVWEFLKKIVKYYS